jgi:hypothetical protein
MLLELLLWFSMLVEVPLLLHKTVFRTQLWLTHLVEEHVLAAQKVPDPTIMLDMDASMLTLLPKCAVFVSYAFLLNYYLNYNYILLL